ncbi:MAG: hypothetical protein ACHQ1G_11935, partial [Planctomycetota bacterium]
MLRYLVSLAVVVALVACSKPEQKGSEATATPKTTPPVKKVSEQEPEAAPEPPTTPTNDPALKACDTFIAEQGIDRTK